MIKIRNIKINEEKYPIELKKIKNPPKQIYYEGNINLINTNMIAIIGSRECSKMGKEITDMFVKGLVNQDISIISGMAIGIDSQAHISAIKYGGKTIAVLPSGLKKIYPEENIKIYREIIKNDGLIITEYEPNIIADSKKFLERNRIVSGLSRGILIIEAMYRSGTSVTAKMAKEQEKKVFAVPHEIDNKLGKGTNKLIKKGAILVTEVKDIIKEFPDLKYKDDIQGKSKERERKEKKQYKKEIEKESKRICGNKEYNQIYQYINNDPITIEEIYQKTQKNINEINNILLMLEIEGFVKKVGGSYICI